MVYRERIEGIGNLYYQSLFTFILWISFNMPIISAKLLDFERQSESSSSDMLASSCFWWLKEDSIREADEYSDTSNSSSSVMSLITNDVVDWKEGAKSGKVVSTFAVKESVEHGEAERTRV